MILIFFHISQSSPYILQIMSSSLTSSPSPLPHTDMLLPTQNSRPLPMIWHGEICCSLITSEIKLGIHKPHGHA